METVLKRLESQRARLRNIYFAHGVFQILFRAGLCVGGLFFLDYSMDLPRGMRLTLTVGVLLYLGIACYRYLYYPLSRPFTRKDIALALERKYHALDGGLVSALEFHGLDPKETGTTSVQLMSAAMDWAGQKADSVDWPALFDVRRIKRLAMISTAVLLVLVGAAMLRPDLAGIWASRVMGSTMSWPRATTLLIELESGQEQFKLLSEPDPRGPQELLISRGSSLPIRIHVEGRDPQEVRVVYEAGSTEKLRAQANRRGAGAYWYRFRNVRENMRFWVEGGDDSGLDRAVDVTVLVPPQVVKVRAEYHYPDYLNMEPEARESSQIEGPEGTRVDLTFTLSKPAESALISLRTSKGIESSPLSPGEEDPVQLKHILDLVESGTYQIQLTGREGFASREAAYHPILVRKDSEPRVKIYAPRKKSLDLGPRGVVVFRAAAVDDYGVAAMRFKYKSAGEAEWEVHDFTEAEIDAPLGSKVIGAGHLIDFDLTRIAVDGEPRKFDRGDVLLYAVEARDFKPDHDPGVAGEGGYVINIVSENEKIRILSELQIRLKEEVRSLRDLQADRLEKTEACIEASDEEGWGEQDLIALEIGQNRLTSRYQSVTRELAAIFDGYLFNRIDRTQAATAFLYQAVALHLDAEMNDAFDPGIYQDLIAIYESGTIGEMSLMERLTVLLGMSLDLSETLSPEAAGLIARAVVAAAHSDAVDLASESLEKQKIVLSTLDQLLVKMDEWEDYQELLQLFRDMIDSQHNLNILMREELRKRK